MGDVIAPSPSSPTNPEQAKDIGQFSDKERQALLADGAVIYPLSGETIATQREKRRAEHQPSFWYVVNGGRLSDRPSRLSEVAIYPDPARFFIENSGGKTLPLQEQLAKEDSEKLRKRLGVEGITVVIPEEASTLTGVAFKHLDITGERLFSQQYAEVHDSELIYGRTKNPSLMVGSFVSPAGHPSPEDGLCVENWGCDDGCDFLWAVRLVVPKGSAVKE